MKKGATSQPTWRRITCRDSFLLQQAAQLPVVEAVELVAIESAVLVQVRRVELLAEVPCELGAAFPRLGRVAGNQPAVGAECWGSQ